MSSTDPFPEGALRDSVPTLNITGLSDLTRGQIMDLAPRRTRKQPPPSRLIQEGRPMHPGEVAAAAGIFRPIVKAAREIRGVFEDLGGPYAAEVLQACDVIEGRARHVDELGRDCFVMSERLKQHRAPTADEVELS